MLDILWQRIRLTDGGGKLSCDFDYAALAPATYLPVCRNLIKTPFTENQIKIIKADPVAIQADSGDSVGWSCSNG